METLITRDVMAFKDVINLSIIEHVALERGVGYHHSSKSWEKGDVTRIFLIRGQQAYWRSIASRGSFRKDKAESFKVSKVTHKEVKSCFQQSILNTIKFRGNIDISAVQKIFSNQEIRQYFPQLSNRLPPVETEIIESSNNKLLDSLSSGFYATDILSAMSQFNKAKTSGRYILPLVNPPQKMLVKAHICLAEGLVLLCQGLIENEKIFFEESMHKLDEATDIIPSVNYSLKLFLRTLLTEDENSRRRKLNDARRISSEMLSKDVTKLERDLTNFFLRYVGD